MIPTLLLSIMLTPAADIAPEDAKLATMFRAYQPDA